MRPFSSCQNCRSGDFLGVECAWPASHCLGPHPGTVNKRRARTMRLLALTTTTIVLAGLARQFLA